MRLNDARLRLAFARNYMREVQRDMAAKDIPAPDGNFAFQKALRAENFGLAEYSRVLQIFTDLMYVDEIPDEGDWRKAAGAE